MDDVLLNPFCDLPPKYLVAFMEDVELCDYLNATPRRYLTYEMTKHRLELQTEMTDALVVSEPLYWYPAADFSELACRSLVQILTDANCNHCGAKGNVAVVAQVLVCKKCLQQAFEQLQFLDYVKFISKVYDTSLRS